MFWFGEAQGRVWCLGVLLGVVSRVADFCFHTAVFIIVFLVLRVWNALGVRCEARLLGGGVPRGSMLRGTAFVMGVVSGTGLVASEFLVAFYVDGLSIPFSSAWLVLRASSSQQSIGFVSGLQVVDFFFRLGRLWPHTPACRLGGVHFHTNLELQDGKISCVKEARVLELAANSRLTKVPHLRYIEEACTAMKALSLRVLTHTSRGADRQTDPPPLALISYCL